MKLRYLFRAFICSFLTLLPYLSSSQVLTPDETKTYYLIHSSGNVIGAGTDDRTVIQAVSGGDEQLVQFIPDGTGYYSVKLLNQTKYMALSGSWNTYFVADNTSDASKYAIEEASTAFVKLKCKSNSKYLGTDNVADGSNVYSDKSGSDTRHYWYIAEEYGAPPADTVLYRIDPSASFEKSFEGWGVSLCWWANMTGNWSDDKIDELVDWLVSPDQLNYNIFRYNIGGGDDPLNRNCDVHHMASGKGIRAEMEGFKLYEDSAYDWSRDATQRKIMLKIKEKRPDAIFEAFSNSAPYYMTYSGCCAGNVSASDDNLKPAYYGQFAEYLVDVCKFYKDSFDIEFKTLEPFNEPVTNYWSANGGQEGCHFSTAAQIDFLKVLAPVLQASGLNTIISSSDETSVSQSVTDFEAYKADGEVLSLVGQWNTHTYSATNPDRSNIRALATEHDMPLWMSEVGAGGSGLSGNLSLAQKLMNDMRYIRPEAWVDWQYVEENTDQWCLVEADFAGQTYDRVKNFYVRYQFSHYIKQGSTFLNVPNDQMLAALSPSGDSLVVVMLNTSGIGSIHKVDLSLFDVATGAGIVATRTSDSENSAPVSDFEINDSILTVEAPGLSITTVVIPVSYQVSDNAPKEATPYLIVARNASLMLQSNGESVELGDYVLGDSTQLWTLTASDDSYEIQNLSGKWLTEQSSYYALASSEAASGQTFNLESVGDDCYKILSASTDKALDLDREGYTSGTLTGFYAYGSTMAASHRQWMFVLPPFQSASDVPSGLEDIVNETGSASVRIIGAEGAVMVLRLTDEPGLVNIYTLNGALLQQNKITGESLRVPVKSGIYVVSYQSKNGEVENQKVMVW